jgi:hypothetical protein
LLATLAASECSTLRSKPSSIAETRKSWATTGKPKAAQLENLSSKLRKSNFFYETSSFLFADIHQTTLGKLRELSRTSKTVSLQWKYFPCRRVRKSNEIVEWIGWVDELINSRDLSTCLIIERKIWKSWLCLTFVTELID